MNSSAPTIATALERTRRTRAHRTALGLRRRPDHVRGAGGTVRSRRRRTRVARPERRRPRRDPRRELPSLCRGVHGCTGGGDGAASAEHSPRHARARGHRCSRSAQGLDHRSRSRSPGRCGAAGRDLRGVGCPARSCGADCTCACRRGRSGAPVLHGRHDRPAQGRDAQSSQPGGELVPQDPGVSLRARRRVPRGGTVLPRRRHGGARRAALAGWVVRRPAVVRRGRQPRSDRAAPGDRRDPCADDGRRARRRAGGTAARRLVVAAARSRGFADHDRPVAPSARHVSRRPSSPSSTARRRPRRSSPACPTRNAISKAAGSGRSDSQPSESRSRSSTATVSAVPDRCRGRGDRAGPERDGRLLGGRGRDRAPRSSTAGTARATSASSTTSTTSPCSIEPRT